MKLTLEQIKKRPSHRSAIIIGPPKSGKTYSLASLLPRFGPVWVFNFDGSDAAEPLVRQAILRGQGGKDVVIFEYGKVANRVAKTENKARGSECFLDFVKDFNALFDLVDPNTGLWKPGAEAPGTIVFDSATAFQAVIMDFVLAMVGHDLGAKGTDARSDYGKQMGKLEETVESALSLPCNFVMLCHERLEKDDLIGQIMLLPMVTGQLAAHIGRHFGAVLYAKTQTKDGKTDYVWLTKPDGFVKSAGIRSLDGVPPTVPQDFNRIWS